jgi:hypothetical protein
VEAKLRPDGGTLQKSLFLGRADCSHFIVSPSIYIIKVHTLFLTSYGTQKYTYIHKKIYDTIGVSLSKYSKNSVVKS